MGDIGRPVRTIEFEPIEEPGVPEPSYAPAPAEEPAAPVETPVEEPVPA